MSSLGRLAVASRAFCVATILGLTLAFEVAAGPTSDARSAVALQATLLLAAISACALAASLASPLPESWIALAEGLFGALVIGSALPEGRTLLPYLMIPTLLAGVSTGVLATVATGVVEVASLAVITTLGAGELFAGRGVDVAPWVLASIGMGALGCWLRHLRSTGSGPSDDASYESARRLLSQLRTVARRLSSGLDPVSMATQMLGVTHQHLGDTHAAVFVRTEGGVLAPLGYRGPAAKHDLLAAGHVVDVCWAEMEPAHVLQPQAPPERRHRIALPLRSASRMIGVVLAEAPEAPTPRTLAALMQEVDEQALRLDTALVFDEVRSIATTEERQRLAREIHDGVAQEVASLGYVVDDLSAIATTEEQHEQLRGLRSEITRVVSELRLSIFDLRSEISPSAGLGSALSDYVRGVGARSGLTVHLTLDEAPTRLRSEVETELLRIAQEAITNARKHAQAENLWVDCRIHPPFASLVVRDDGRGLGTARVDSYGLKIMRERAGRIDATLEIASSAPEDPGSGTTVAVTVGGPIPSPVPISRSS